MGKIYIFNDHGDVFYYLDLYSASIDLEVEDVLANRYEGFTSNGEKLDIQVESMSKILISNTNNIDELKLKNILEDFLKADKKEVLDNSLLECLVMMLRTEYLPAYVHRNKKG